MFFALLPSVASVISSCDSSCASCDISDVCLTCIATNTYTDGLSCYCNDGYYPIGSLTTIDACQPCHPHCSICSDSSTCTGCKAKGAIIALSGCECNLMTYISGSLSSINGACLNCPDTCYTCTSLNNCTECFDMNSYIGSDLQCHCNDGFFWEIGEGMYCADCFYECKTCEDYNSCTTCKVEFSEPATMSQSYCECKPGYYYAFIGGAARMLQDYACYKCMDMCETCMMGDMCETCVDINSEVSSDGLCYCIFGYYSLSVINSSTSCIQCHPHCYGCSSTGICNLCIDRNAIQLDNTNGCECSEGYFPSSIDITQSLECQKCSEDCEVCSFNPYKCKSCITENAIPNSNGDCICKDGYYGLLPLIDIVSCFKCYSDCKTCTDSLKCVTCVSTHATPNVILGCDCDQGYYKATTGLCNRCKSGCFTCITGTECTIQCHSSCKTCNGQAYYDCTSCENKLLRTICSISCPVGFIDVKGKCEYSTYTIPTIYYNFQGYGKSYYYDIYQKLPASIKSINTNKRKLSDIAGPISSYMRGVYFPGSSSLLIERENQKIFNIEFSISLWVKPEIESAVLISKYNQSYFINYLKLYIDKGSVKAEIFVDGVTIEYQTEFKINLEEWNHVYFALSYDEDTSLKAWINNVQGPELIIADAVFLDSDSSLMLIGSDKDYKDSYKGFFYSLEIFAAFQELSTLVSIDVCTDCNTCLTDGSCIPICLVTEYFSSESEKCENCPSICPTSCKDSNNCNLCADENCLSCYDYLTGSCYECQIGFKLTSPNCTRNYFTASIEINKDNSVNLNFDEDLLASLLKSDLQVLIDKKKSTYSLKELDSKSYLITFEKDDIDIDSTLSIFFASILTSVDNSLLKTEILTGEFYLTEELKAEKELQDKADAAKKLGRIGATSGASIALGLSLISMDASSIFDFLNTAEIMYSIYLFSLNLNPILNDFLLGLRLQDSLPNFFYIIIDSEKGVELDPKIKKFGYSTNLILLSAGLHIQTLICFLLGALGVFILSLSKWIKKKIGFLIKTFKYGIFLRFWIQTFFEILTVLGFSFKYSKFENGVQIFDFVICLIICAAEIAGCVFFGYLLKKRRKLENDEDIENFLKKFGTFFEEFKKEKLKFWLFYLIYILRRVTLLICFQFISNPQAQLVLSLFFALIISSYVFFTRNFREFIYNIYHVLNEIVIAIYCCVLLAGSNDTIQSEALADACIKLIITAWALNLACSLFNTIKSLVEKIKKCLAKRKKAEVENKYKHKTAPQIDILQDTGEAQVNDVKEVHLD